MKYVHKFQAVMYFWGNEITDGVKTFSIQIVFGNSGCVPHIFFYLNIMETDIYCIAGAYGTEYRYFGKGITLKYVFLVFGLPRDMFRKSTNNSKK